MLESIKMPTMSRAGKFMDAARKKIDLESFQKKKKIVNNKLAMILVVQSVSQKAARDKSEDNSIVLDEDYLELKRKSEQHKPELTYKQAKESLHLESKELDPFAQFERTQPRALLDQPFSRSVAKCDSRKNQQEQIRSDSRIGPGSYYPSN